MATAASDGERDTCDGCEPLPAPIHQPIMSGVIPTHTSWPVGFVADTAVRRVKPLGVSGTDKKCFHTDELACEWGADTAFVAKRRTNTLNEAAC